MRYRTDDGDAAADHPLHPRKTRMFNNASHVATAAREVLISPYSVRVITPVWMLDRM